MKIEQQSIIVAKHGNLEHSLKVTYWGGKLHV